MSNPQRIEVKVVCRDLNGNPNADYIAEDLKQKVEAVVMMWRMTTVGRRLHADPVVEMEVVRLCEYTGRDGKGCLLKEGHHGKHWPTDTCIHCGEEDTEGHFC